jgi:hypothetical protein
MTLAINSIKSFPKVGAYLFRVSKVSSSPFQERQHRLDQGDYSIIQPRKDEKLIAGQSFSSRSRTMLTGAPLNEHGEQAKRAEGDLLFLVPPRDDQSLLRSAPARVIRITPSGVRSKCKHELAGLAAESVWIHTHHRHFTKRRDNKSFRFLSSCGAQRRGTPAAQTAIVGQSTTISPGGAVPIAQRFSAG